MAGAMLNIMEVDETNKMIEQEKLDVRTVTMGVLLIDCEADNVDMICERIYCKIVTQTRDLVSAGRAIEWDYGIPIVNKRITVTLISLVGAGACKNQKDFARLPMLLTAQPRQSASLRAGRGLMCARRDARLRFRDAVRDH
jgi:uncharacterized protein